MYFHPLHCLLLLFSYNSWFLFSQQTSRVVTYTSHIQPACLVTSQTKTDDLIHDTSFVGDHENCTVLGWGLTCKYASYWKILRNTCSIVQSTPANPGANITYLFYRSFITILRVWYYFIIRELIMKYFHRSPHETLSYKNWLSNLILTKSRISKVSKWKKELLVHLDFYFSKYLFLAKMKIESETFLL